MRITEKRYPILKYLKYDGDLKDNKEFMDKVDICIVGPTDVDLGLAEGAIRSMKPFLLNWPYYRKQFSKNITVLSKTFAEAAVANAGKVITVETLTALEGKQLSGTIIYKGMALCYDITELSVNGSKYEAVEWGEGLLSFVHSKDGGFLSAINTGKEKPTKEQRADYDRHTFLFPILIHLFKRYAEVEVVDAKPFKKVQIQDEDKKDTLLVDSTLPMSYLDCSWFRTIVRKEGFMVRGHFRMQPYKNEKREWDYKLIYIEPFQKHGYTRTAKKVVEARRNPDETTQG